ncbi:helix-turn-helix domain-containing protein [Rhodospirillum sp. A1_3_36]|uniref:helix-turn-helix domain-containing protein n=1 Tax=Rhodospirillum sp. A1_3_36 TaxID=3391666 RepID=UPI0039A469DB
MRETIHSPESGGGRDRAPSPVDLHVGRRLRERRRSLRTSQRALGDWTGVTFQQIQKYELGTNRISASRLYDFAKVLRVPLSYFFEGLPSPILLTSLEGDPMMHPLTLSVVSAFNRIPSAKVRAAALALLQSMVDRGG